MRARAQERERERERERTRSEVELSLSLSLFCFSDRFCGALFSSPKRHTTLPSPPNRRIGEASTIGKRLLKREKRKDDAILRAHHRGALVFSRTFRVDFLLTIVFYRVMSATISIRRSVPPPALLSSERARVFARITNKRTKK